MTEKYQDLHFTAALEILEAERSRSSNRFDAFGAEVPTDQMAYWGVPIVLLVQMYFLFHFRAFRAVIISATPGRGPETPWIVSYRAGDARAFAVISLVAFPPLVVTLLLGSEAVSTGEVGAWAFTSIATVLSIFVNPS